MWGSSFADLAKKAAELQEQASSSLATPSAVSSFTSTAGGLFNMDALQEQDGDDDKGRNSHPTPALQQPTAAAASAAKSSSSSSSSFSTSSFLGGAAAAAGTSMNLFGTSTGATTAPTPAAPAPPHQSTTSIPKLPHGGRVAVATNVSNTTPAKKSLQLGSTSLRVPVASTASSSPTTKGKLRMPPKAAATTTTTTSATASPNNNNNNNSAILTAKKLSSAPAGPVKLSTPVKPNHGMKATAANNEQTQETTIVLKPHDQISPTPPSSSASPPSATSPVTAPSFSTAAMESDNSPGETPADHATATPLSTVSTQKVEEGDEDDSAEAEGWDEDDDLAVESEEFNVSNKSDGTTRTSPPTVRSSMSEMPHPVTMDHDDETNTGDDTDDAALPTNESTKNSGSVPPPLSIQPKAARTNGAIPPTPTAPLSVQRGILVRGTTPTNAGMATNNNNNSNGGTTEKEMERLQEQFSEQLQRLEENHQAEQASRQQEFDRSLADLQSQLQERDSRLRQQEMGRKQLEDEHGKHVQTLRRDLDHSKELLADKEREGRRLQEAHLQQLRDMEKQINRKEDTSHGLEQQMQVLQKALEESKAELQTSQDEYATLKDRAKGVAGELKERRVECRTLASEIELLQGNNGELQDRITELEAQGMDMNQSSQETMDELNSLRAQLKDMEKLVEEAQMSIDQERQKSEEALAGYKRKAQQSLALANSRAAAAVQSKEEAELEARASRTTADSAMQRALSAEANGKQAMAEAKAYVTEMEKDFAKYNEVKDSLETVTNELEKVRSESSKYQDSAEQLQCELTSVAGQLEAEQATVESLKQSLSNAQDRSTELYNELERLRREGQRNRDELRRLSEAKSDEVAAESKAPAVPARNAEAETTIAMLKRELEDANQAIRDLKETLKATMEEKDASSPRGQQSYASNGDSNGGMPLFYAMEKQAELTQARDEIARLANLLGDAESTKQEALEAMVEMKTLMDDAHARLKRQEQLQQSPEQESVNLEYLKNIMLSFLNAKSVQEKKALLPVLGTVLCLTPDEQRKAMELLDKGNGSVMDSVTSSVLNMKWS